MTPGANATVDIYHMIYGSSTNTYPDTPDITGVECYLESQKAEIQAALDQGFNVDVFYMHTDPVEIDTGDKVTDGRGREFRVMGIERHEDNPDGEDLLTITLHKERNTAH